MSLPSHQKLLKELASRNYRQRQRFLRDLALENAGSEGLEKLQRELETGDVFERCTGLFLGIVNRDQERILDGLLSPSRSVRALAVWAAPKLCLEHPRFLDVVMAAPPAALKELRFAIVRSGSEQLAEELFRRLEEERGLPAAARVLPACGDALARARFPECGQHVFCWEMMAQRHPEVHLAHLRNLAKESMRPATRNNWWWNHLKMIRPLLRHQPEEALTFIVEREVSWWGLPGELQAFLWKMVARGQVDQVRPLLESAANRAEMANYGPNAGFARYVHDVPSEIIEDIVSFLIPKLQFKLVELFRCFSHQQRAVLVEAWEHANPEEVSRAPWHVDLLALLPHRMRQRLARVALDAGAGRLREKDRFELLSLLDFDEVLPLLEEEFSANSPERRVAGYEFYLKTVRSNPHRLLEALDELIRRTANEQDPVRLAVFTGLAAFPEGMWRLEEAAGRLESLATAALESRDVSWGTLGKLAEVLAKVVQANGHRTQSESFQLALKCFVEIGTRQGSFPLDDLEDRLPSGAEFPLVEAMANVIGRLNKRESYALLSSLVQALGRRGRKVKQQGELMDRAILENPRSASGWLLHSWLQDPSQRDRRVEALLKKDASAIALNEVFTHVDRERQDLLGPYLTGDVISGAFMTGKTLHILPARSWFHRWHPDQQRAFAGLLKPIIPRKATTDQEKRNYCLSLAAMPASSLDDFHFLVKEGDVVRQEAALGALPQLDEVEAAVGVLLQHLEGDRARVAMYALPRCLGALPPERGLELVANILEDPGAKVTVRKEAVRLLGRFQSPRSVELLEQVYQEPKQHRHVLVAIGHAARELVANERVWPLLEAMASDERKDVPRSLVEIAPPRFSATQRLRYGRLLLSLTDHGAPEVRAALFRNLGPWVGGLEAEVGRVCREVICELRAVDPSCWEDAGKQLVQAGVTAKGASELVLAMRSLSQVMLENGEEEEHRDCPGLQRLEFLIEQLALLGEEVRLPCAPGWQEEVIGHLLEDPKTLGVGLRLFFLSIDWRSPNAVNSLERLRAVTDRWPIAIDLGRSAISASLRSWKSAPPDESIELIDALVAYDDLLAHLAGFELLVRMGSSRNWPEELRKQLRNLREHPDPQLRVLGHSAFVDRERTS